MCVCVGGRVCLRVCVYMWVFSTARRIAPTTQGGEHEQPEREEGQGQQEAAAEGEAAQAGGGGGAWVGVRDDDD